ncbi:MAG: alpha/beta hydrolase [Gammaproteobacteria bacterium WSBS_2016_MAG_OTU1]
MTKTILLLAGSAFAAWTATGICLWRWQEKLIFHPAPTPPDAIRELADLAIEITTADGKVLRGWQHPGNPAANSTNCKLLIYFGGNNEELSTQLIDNGMRFACPQWYINYRGFGQSEGKPAADSMRSDALQIADEAAKQLGIAHEDMCIMGRSLGTHMAAHVAANRPIKNLILITPFDSALNVAKKRYPIFPVAKMLRHHFNTLNEVKTINAPTLFLLAETDFIVPYKNSENLINHWQGAHTVLKLPNTTHGKIESPNYWNAITHFISPQNEDDESDEMGDSIQ